MFRTHISEVLLSGLLFLGVTGYSGNVSANDVYIIKKQEKKRANRWSLQEWLETRDRIMLMDLWLAVHSPSPYEFFAGADYQYTSLQPSGIQEHRVRAHGGAYASLFGLQFLGDFLGSETVLNSSFHIRLFGYHIQGTNFTVHVGLRNMEESGVWSRNLFVGANLAIYWARFFGTDVMFQFHAPGTPRPGVGTAFGYRTEAGGFVDFSFLRLYGSYFYDLESPNGAGANTIETGAIVGARIFF